MLTHGSLAKVSDALSEGFFADNVVMSLRRGETINSERRALLEEVEEYISRIEKGRNQVSTGKLSDNAIASNDAYGRMLGIVVKMTPNATDHKIIEKLTRTIEKEVEDTLQSGRIDPQKLKTTIEFFQFVREATLRDSASIFGWESVALSKPVGVP